MVKNHIILGINWEQNSTAALMINGKIVGCSSEERFSRVKNDERYPINAINWLLKDNKIRKSQIDRICFISKTWSPMYLLTRHYTRYSIDDYINEQNDYWYKKIFLKEKVNYFKIFKNKIDFNQFPGKSFWKKEIKKLLHFDNHVSNRKVTNLGQEIRKKVISKHLDIPLEKIFFIDHSLGHAFYAYFGSPKHTSKNKYVITLDAFGDYKNYSCYKFGKASSKLKVTKIIDGNNFIGARLYRYITLILGLKPNEHEYKVMGLAPYCKPVYSSKILKILTSFQGVKNISFIDKRKPKDLYFSLKKMIDGSRFDSISGGLQNYIENLVYSWVKALKSKYNFSSLSIAGGVSLNVKLNFFLGSLIKDVFVPPSPDDASQAMGACYVQNHNDNKKNFHLDNAYLGYNININETENIIKKNINKRLYRVYRKNINEIAAKSLSLGKIIARVKNKAEFGARALGNRSILASPKNETVKEKINENIKNRDFWMPFAASVLEKHSKEYFILKGDTRKYSYMTNCLECTKDGKNKLKAAIHPYDKTCRPQIIKKNTNKDYEDLIYRFGKKTGVYALLNTSFNLHGYPIVNNVKEAIEIFKKTKIDGLILGNIYIQKK